MLQNDENLLKEDKPEVTLRVEPGPEPDSDAAPDTLLAPPVEPLLQTDPLLPTDPLPQMDPQPQTDPTIQADRPTQTDPALQSSIAIAAPIEYTREVDYEPTKLVPISWTYFYIAAFAIIGIPVILFFWFLMKYYGLLFPPLHGQ